METTKILTPTAL